MHKINRRINFVNQELYSHNFYPHKVKEYFIMYRPGYVGEILTYKEDKSSISFLFLFSTICKERMKV